MDKEELIKLLKQEFKDKNFDEYSLNLLCNAIYEFDSLFGKYMSRERVVELAKKNINSIEVVEKFEKKGVIGTYNRIQKRIALMSRLNEEEMKSTLFHEFVHAIMNGKDFRETFSVPDFSESGLEVSIGTGLVEGFTQYVTKIRDNAFSSSQLITYPILTEQVENLSSLMGEEKLLNLGFNSPENLANELFETFFESQYLKADYYEFLSAFDVILQEESRIYSARNESATTNFIKELEKRLGQRNHNQLTEAKLTIISTFEELLLNKPISSIEEFNKIYLELSKYCNQLGTKPNEKMLTALTQKMDELTEKGITQEEIIGNIDEEFKVFYLYSNIAKDFISLSREQKLEKLIDTEFYNSLNQLYEEKYYNSFGKKLLADISNAVLPNNSVESAMDLFLYLRNGLAKEIKDNEYNIDRLSYEKVNLYKDTEYKESPLFKIFQQMMGTETLINLYDTDGKKRTYLGSFIVNDELNVVKFDEKVSEEERKRLTEQYNELMGAAIIGTKNGERLGMLEDKYTFVDSTGEIYTNNSESEYHPSRLENLHNELKYYQGRRKYLEELGAPDSFVMIEKSKEEKVQREIEALLEPESTIKPEEPTTSENMQEENEDVMPMQALKNALQTTTTEETQKAQSVEAQLEEEKRKEGETIDD